MSRVFLSLQIAVSWLHPANHHILRCAKLAHSCRKPLLYADYFNDETRCCSLSAALGCLKVKENYSLFVKVEERYTNTKKTVPSVSSAMKSEKTLSHCISVRVLTINELNRDLSGYGIPVGPQVCIHNANARGRAAQMRADETNEDRGGVELSQIGCF